jgi:hypothetical protein
MWSNKELTKQKKKASKGCKRVESLSEFVKQEAYVNKSFYGKVVQRGEFNFEVGM